MIHLFEQLFVSKDLTKSNVTLLENYVERWSVLPFDAIVETHLLSESVLADRMADLFQLTRMFAIEPQLIEPELLAKVPFATAKRLRVLPIRAEEPPHQSTLVLVDPTHPDLAKLKAELDYIKLAVAEKSVIEDAILSYYPIELQLPSLLGDKEQH